MNILCISHEYPPVGGGGATACLNICRQYAKKGHRVVVLTSAYEETPLHENVAGVEIHRVRCKRSSKDHSSFAEMLSFLTAAFGKTPSLMKQTAFDVCQVFFGIPSGPLGWYIHKRWKVPYVVRLGGGDVPGTQKRFDKIYKLIAPFLKSIWKNARYVVANSEGLCQRAQAFSRQAHFRVIPNGIDPEDFLTLQPQPDADTLRLVTVARIVERKGMQSIVAALPEIIKRTDGHVAYTIIGDGPYRADIERQATELGVSSYMQITGMIDRSLVLDTLCKNDIFLLTSHWEGMPNVVLEAMAAGLPILMTDCEGSAELVHDNGYVLALQGDVVAQIVDAVMKLYHDPALRTRMGNASRQRIMESFTWEKAADAYLALFRGEEDMG